MREAQIVSSYVGHRFADNLPDILVLVLWRVPGMPDTFYRQTAALVVPASVRSE